MTPANRHELEAMLEQAPNLTIVARRRLWRRLEREMQSKCHRPIVLRAAGAFVASAAALAVAAFLVPVPPAADAVVLRATTRQSLTLPTRLRVDESPATVRLARGVDLEVMPGSELTLDMSSVSLERGSSQVDVTPGRGRFEVVLGEVRVVVLGTRFWVARSGADSAVCLLEGKLEILRRGERVAVLTSGNGWRSSGEAPAFRSDQPCQEQVITQLAPMPRGYLVTPHPKVATVFSDVAPSILDVQNALYDTGLAQLARGETSLAVATWNEYRRRFPEGALRQEVDLSALEAQIARGDEAAALAEADAFLARHDRSERKGEVLALRAVLRHRRGDLRSAIEDYEAALRLGVRKELEAKVRLGRASCLGTLGADNP